VDKLYTALVTVRHHELDCFGRVHPSTYLRVLAQTAVEASTAAGYDADWYAAAGCLWLVRRSTFDLVRPARAEEPLEIRTWVEDFRRVRSHRSYEVRVHGDTLVRARTTGCTSTPRRGGHAASPRRSRRASAWRAFPRPSARPWQSPPPPANPARSVHRVRVSDLDGLAHMNNAAYLDVLVQAVFDALDDVGWSLDACIGSGAVPVLAGADVEYLESARYREQLDVATWFTPTADGLEAHQTIGATAARGPWLRATTRWCWYVRPRATSERRAAGAPRGAAPALAAAESRHDARRTARSGAVSCSAQPLEVRLGEARRGLLREAPRDVVARPRGVLAHQLHVAAVLRLLPPTCSSSASRPAGAAARRRMSSSSRSGGGQAGRRASQTRSARAPRGVSRNRRRRRVELRTSRRATSARSSRSWSTWYTCPMFGCQNGPDATMELLQEPVAVRLAVRQQRQQRISHVACVPPAARRAIRMPPGGARGCARRARRCQPRLTLRAYRYAGTDFGARLQIHVPPLPSSGDASRRRRRAERPAGRALRGRGRLAPRASRVAGAAPPHAAAAPICGRAHARRRRGAST
jgi:acyl-CoA thioesterase FadM